MGETTKIAWTDQGAARVHVRKYAESALRVIETAISSQRGQVALGRPAWRAASIVRQKRNTLFAEVLDAFFAELFPAVGGVDRLADRGDRDG